MMLFSLITAVALGSSPTGPALSATADGGQVLSSDAGSITYPLTNGHVIFSSNASANITLGQEFTIAGASNAISLDNLTPEIAGLSGTRTVWGSAGTVKIRGTFSGSNGVTSATTVFAANEVISGASYFLTFSNYVPGTLLHHTFTNVTTRTNAGKTAALFSGRSTNGWAWSTNSLLSGLTGLTGLSMPTNGWTYTAITPRHAYTAAHIYPGWVATNASGLISNVLRFVGTDGTTNTATVTGARGRYSDNGSPSEDYTLVVFSADLPASVEPLRVAWRTNVEAKLPWYYSSGVDNPRAWLETCQHGRVGSQMMTLFDDHQMHIGGDSGNPALIIVSNYLVNFGGTSGTLLSTQFLADLNALTTQAGLATNSYQPTIDSLSQFPNP